MKKWTSIAILAVGIIGCGDEGEPVEAQQEEIPCGIRVCEEDSNDDWGPENVEVELTDAKADANGVRLAINELTADGVLDASDIERIFGETGNRVSRSEMGAIRDGLYSTDHEVTEEAMQLGLDLALTANLSDVEKEYLLANKSFGGTDVPDAVRRLISEARLGGAVAYDVNETNTDGEMIWTPYPATTPATANMAFDYTEITPKALQDDMDDTDLDYQRITGTEMVTSIWGQEYEQATYESAVGGTGNVISHYDHAYHPNIWARGRSGQKWANNFAILSDGTFHALPAARRSVAQDLILTNPHLSRGVHMLFNGHLDIRAGVVTGVEMSGRLSKRVAKGKANMINPIPLLEAWGFEMSSTLRVRFGNTSAGAPVFNEETHTFEEAASQP